MFRPQYYGDPYHEFLDAHEMHNGFLLFSTVLWKYPSRRSCFSQAEIVLIPCQARKSASIERACEDTLAESASRYATRGLIITFGESSSVISTETFVWAWTKEPIGTISTAIHKCEGDTAKFIWNEQPLPFIVGVITKSGHEPFCASRLAYDILLKGFYRTTHERR